MPTPPCLLVSHEPDPIGAIRRLAEELLRPRHGLFEELVQTGLLAYYEYIEENNNATKN